LGYDRQREEEEAKKKEAEKVHAAASSKARPAEIGNSKPTTPVPGKVDTLRGKSQDLERLGMGFKKLGFGAVPSGAPTSAAKPRYFVLSF
jgi:ADP-ribosylation factor GTPase-activating protein 2/3